MFLISTLDSEELLASGSDRFILGQRTPEIHWTRGLTGIRCGLDVVAWRTVPLIFNDAGQIK